jgi:hypothetical protein
MGLGRFGLQTSQEHQKRDWAWDRWFPACPFSRVSTVGPFWILDPLSSSQEGISLAAGKVFLD